MWKIGYKVAGKWSYIYTVSEDYDTLTKLLDDNHITNITIKKEVKENE